MDIKLKFFFKFKIAFSLPWVFNKIVAEFEKRRNFLHKEINKIHSLKCFKPGGTFYTFPNVSKTGLNGKKFADIALNEKGVALVPGTSFGDSANDFIRISFANSIENIEKALYRISTIWKKLKL